MKLVNLTPHPISIQTIERGINGAIEYLTIRPSGIVARVPEEHEYLYQITVPEGETIDIMRAHYGSIVDLPEPIPNIMFIVSLMIRQAATHRADLVSPGAMIRDSEGRILACRNLLVN